MSLFGSLMADMEEDYFGSHMRHMRQNMDNMMNSLFSDTFGMLRESPLSIMGHHHSNSLMPYMPQMPALNRIFSTGLDGGMGAGSSYSSSTLVMSNGPNGKPQVISSTSSTRIGPNGVKETKKTHQDSRTGTKKMSIGHHIGERAHVIEREQNVYTGDAEERQEFINLDEEEAEDFDREFQTQVGGYSASRSRAAIAPARRSPPRLALPAPPTTNTSSGASSSRRYSSRPTSRRPLRTAASPLTSALPSSSNVREVYGGSHPQRHRHKHHRSSHRHSPADHN